MPMYVPSFARMVEDEGEDETGFRDAAMIGRRRHVKIEAVALIAS